jgi:hypothetical protein
VAIERAATGHSIPAWTLGVAAFAVAVFGLGKLNTGVVIVAISVGTVAAVCGRRQLLVFVGLLAACSAALWLAAGQGLSNILPFIATSAETIAGFNSAMGIDQDRAVYWLVAAAAVVTAALAYSRFEAVAPWPPRLRIVVAAVLALVLFITFKASFVRWHVSFIFGTLLILSVATLTPRVSRRTGLLAVACALVAFLGATRLDAWSFLEPTPGNAIAQRLTLRANHLVAEQGRRDLARLYAVDASILSRLSGESVHIGPLEAGIAFAHPDLDWTPLPAYQDYAVYTSGLDDLNRDVLLDPQAAPRFMLRSQPMTIDGRYPWFEGPATMRATQCHYAEVDVAGPWQLLERGADRCAAPRLLSTVSAEPGVSVAVPRMEDGDAMLFVRIKGLDASIADAAWSFAFKAHEWYITRNETDRYRLVAPTAAQGLIMDVGPDLAYSDDFGIGPAWRSIMVAPGPRSSVQITSIELEFWAVRSASD